MMQVSIEDAYAESCRALGESLVRERLMSVEISRLTSLIEDQDKDKTEQTPE